MCVLLLFYVARAMIKKNQALKRQVSLGQYRKALPMFNSRNVKTVKVMKEGEDIFVKAQIFPSFTLTTNNGITRPAVVLFRNGAPMKGHCQCSVGLFCGIMLPCHLPADLFGALHQSWS